jgi:hypothetical protein
MAAARNPTLAADELANESRRIALCLRYFAGWYRVVQDYNFGEREKYLRHWARQIVDFRLREP